MHLSYQFVPMGFVADPEAGKVYVDVGNAFCAGILDHHHPDAPDTCTAMLVLNHSEFVNSQIVDDALTIIPHQYPDLDAVTGAYFAAMHARDELARAVHHDWADYVCKVDQGFTTLAQNQPVTPYSLFMMRMQGLDKAKDAHAASLIMLEAGFDFLDTLFDWLKDGGDLKHPQGLGELDAFAAEKKTIADDLQKYQQDMQRAEILTCALPEKNGAGSRQVQGLWLSYPTSSLFKSWARGDGFVFLGIQVSEHRFILSVDPSSEVYLKGLGDLLEKAEQEKRKTSGCEIQGENRPGYASPDPWYDGRSPLHNYTIIDSPRAGTILSQKEIRDIFQLAWRNQ